MEGRFGELGEGQANFLANFKLYKKCKISFLFESKMIFSHYVPLLRRKPHIRTMIISKTFIDFLKK